MTDLDRDPTPAPLDQSRSISDLPAPRETAPPSHGSTGAADHVPPDAVEEAGHTGADANPTAPAEGDPFELPRDDVPPVGSIVPDDLPSEDVNTETGDTEQLRTSGL